MRIDSLFPTSVLAKYNVIENPNDLLGSIDLTQRHSKPHIHKEEEFKPLADAVLDLSNQYAEYMNWDCELYLNTMWYNVMNQYEDHRPHNHGNSLLSGVYYPTGDPDHPPIEFFDSKNIGSIAPTVKEYIVQNSDSWHYPVIPNSILIFPAWLQHWVPVNKSPNPRISISFNIMVKGKAGKEDQLTSIVWK